MKFEIEYIEKIAKIVSENQLSEITLEDGEEAISVRKEATVVTSTAAPVVQSAAVQVATNPITAIKEEKASALLFSCS